MNQYRFGISRKVLLIAASFAAPIAVLLYLVVDNINEFIVFGQKEAQGNEFQRPVEEALDALQRTQLAFVECQGAARCGEKFDQAASDVDQAFTKIATKEGQLGEVLQFTEQGLGKRDRNHIRPSIVADEWKQLHTDVSGGAARAAAADTGQRFDHLVNDL